MLLPHTKEREYRFRLALRMGLPIFALIFAIFFSTNENISTVFYIELILLFVFSIYFILYIIYRSFDIRITEAVSKTFTREYLYKYLKKEIEKNKDYTLILISIDNLNDINARYGLKNGDKVLYKVASWIGEYLKEKDIENFPLGHVKGGDFVLGLKGKKSEYKPILELMCLKASEFKVDEIEVKISSAITETSYSDDLNYLIENLFELQEESRTSKLGFKKEEINPSELESSVINAINKKRFVVMSQTVFTHDKGVMRECFLKLKAQDGKILHPKTYMKVINKLGLMSEYDLMIVEKSIDNCLDDKEQIIALTISPTSLRNPSFLAKVKELLKQNENIKSKIMFILNEKEYYSQIERYSSILRSLRSMGVLIAIDKLGSYHTSFLYLRDLEIDMVRFDAIYTKDLRNKGQYKSIVDGFNLMAHEKNVKTWIKMIEDKESKETAVKMQIDYLQGKYLAPLEKIYES